jgi:hypothetical protein
MAEHPAVNRRVVGSSPTSGAKLLNQIEAASETAASICLSGGDWNLVTSPFSSRTLSRWRAILSNLFHPL